MSLSFYKNQIFSFVEEMLTTPAWSSAMTSSLYGENIQK